MSTSGACDSLDSVSDDVIQDYRACCRIDGQASPCPRGANAGDKCLSDDKTIPKTT